MCSLESPLPPPFSLWLCDFGQHSELQCPHQGEVQAPPYLCITTGWITAAQGPVLRILRLPAGSRNGGSIGDSGFPAGAGRVGLLCPQSIFFACSGHPGTTQRFKTRDGCIPLVERVEREQGDQLGAPWWVGRAVGRREAGLSVVLGVGSIPPEGLPTLTLGGTGLLAGGLAKLVGEPQLHTDEGLPPLLC